MRTTCRPAPGRCRRRSGWRGQRSQGAARRPSAKQRARRRTRRVCASLLASAHPDAALHPADAPAMRATIIALLAATAAGGIGKLFRAHVDAVDKARPRSAVIEGIDVAVLKEARDASPSDCKLELTLALNYSSKWEITSAVKSIIDDGLKSDEVEPKTISKYLATAGKPDPELMIRTSGENRISNFMLWQLAYSEFHFSDVLWPDFREEHFIEALLNYQNRDRRFGGVSKSEN